VPWKYAIDDLVERVLKPPQPFITDGNPGLIKAINNVWPQIPRQRCIAHRIRNVLAKIRKKRQDEARKALHRIFYAACLDDTRDEARQFLSRYQIEFPSAAQTLVKHLEECLTFYRFTERHWKHIRTSNVIERAFKEVKSRTKVMGRFPNEISSLVMVFSILDEERLKLQKVKMRADNIAWIEGASKALEQELIKLGFLEEALVA